MFSIHSCLSCLFLKAFLKKVLQFVFPHINLFLSAPHLPLHTRFIDPVVTERNFPLGKLQRHVPRSLQSLRRNWRGKTVCVCVCMCFLQVDKHESSVYSIQYPEYRQCTHCISMYHVAEYRIIENNGKRERKVIWLLLY